MHVSVLKGRRWGGPAETHQNVHTTFTRMGYDAPFYNCILERQIASEH